MKHTARDWRLYRTVKCRWRWDSFETTINRNIPARVIFLQDTKHSPFQRQRNILYLISQYLSDFGLKQTKSTLWHEAGLSSDCKVCDNIDLDTIYLDFCSYYHMRFAKLPKILKRIESDSNDASSSRTKANKLKCPDSTIKVAGECAKKVDNELKRDFIVTGSVANIGDASNEFSTIKVRHHKNVDLLESFSGELRDLAHIIERFVLKSYHFHTED